MATTTASSTSGGTRRAPAKTKAGGGAGKHRGSAASEGGAKKAAAKVAAGGGPENPIADAKAAKALLGGGKKKAGGGSTKFTPEAKDSSHTVKVGSPVLMAEFIICLVILGLGTLASPKGSANAGIPRLMLKSSALSGLFLILALTSSVGGKAQKTAAALGGLVTVTYVVASPDAVALFNWVAGYFGGTKAAPGGAAAAAGAEAGAEAGSGTTGAAQ